MPIPDILSAACVVCGPDMQWVAHLQAKLGVRISVHWSQDLAGCRRILDGYPASVLVLQVEHMTFESLIEFLGWLPQQFPDARAIAVVPRDARGLEWLMREAGAVHVVHSIRGLQGVADIAARQIDRAPRLELTLRQQVFRSLPWGP